MRTALAPLAQRPILPLPHEAHVMHAVGVALDVPEHHRRAREHPQRVRGQDKPDRAQVIDAYKNLASHPGDAAKGQVLFDSICAACHRLRSRGHAVGPDLDMTGAKPPEWLVAAILDPAQTVESRYRGWNVTRVNGSAVAGVIAAETVNNLVLRLPGGVDLPVLRQDIKAMEPIPGSLMPTGFESALPPAAMADLLRYVRSDR